MADETSDYLPLPTMLTIQTSKLHGLGLFATKPIPGGADLGITHVADDRFDNGYVRTPLGGFINYSPVPNCEFLESGDMFRLITLHPIAEGEELTGDYYPWYSREQLATFKTQGSDLE